jgi:predicted ATPase
LYFVDLLRIRGEVVLQHRAVTAKEQSFREALAVARQQEALLWELPPALGFARLRLSQSRGGEARQIVAPVYDRFTEGFETPDPRAAKRSWTNYRGTRC